MLISKITLNVKLFVKVVFRLLYKILNHYNCTNFQKAKYANDGSCNGQMSIFFLNIKGNQKLKKKL
jgi:hypothetical protein